MGGFNRGCYCLSAVSEIFLHHILRLYHQICSGSNRYNKRDVDFSSLREYNDYLEQVEDIGKATEPKSS